MTVFEVISRLADKHGALNLGQGFPTEGWPADVVECARAALSTGNHQYPSTWGLPALRQAVAAHDKAFYGIDVSPTDGVLVTTGASEALSAAILAHVRPGDEVIVFSPMYDLYLPNIRRAGGVAREVALQGPDWEVPWAALQTAFGPRTRLVVLNTPQNPIGKVWRHDELTRLAALVAQHDCLALCDEVYEHLVFDGHRHVPLMTLPGMAKRCLRVASAGKTFSVTGWKVGYVVGDPQLLAPLVDVHQYTVFTVPGHLQQAVAYGLAKEPGYFAELAASMARKRDVFQGGLRQAGIASAPCHGTYFLTVPTAALGREGDDMAVCHALIEEAGVAAIPLSAFCPNGLSAPAVRFCFAKTETLLRHAADRLARFARAA